MSKRKVENSSTTVFYGEGDSSYDDSIYSSEETKKIFQELDKQIVYLPREQFKFRIFHMIHLLPRDKAFYGDVSADGTYPLFRYESGKDVVYPEVKAWPPILEKLRDKIYEMTGQRCNHCVVNQYRDNNDHIGFHFDKTRDFVSNSSVLTLSFGAERILRLKHNKTKAKEDLHLQSGSLFVLGWKTNTIWKHSIVKTKQKCERRVSLTFRSIKTLKHPDGTMTTIESETENENNKITKRMKKATSVEKNQ